MPKSLSTGPSKSVQIKCPEAEKAAIVDVLSEGETLSELTRRLWRAESERRCELTHPDSAETLPDQSQDPS
jgi:hypothetical protein